MVFSINPIPTPNNSVNSGSASGTSESRKITMNTQASPERYEQEVSPIPDAVEQTKMPLEETKPLSPQFAALAKQRRELQLKEKALAEREKALSGTTSNGSDVMARLKSQPLSMLQEAGVTYDQLTEAILATQGNPELQELRAELKTLKEGFDNQFKERDTQAEQQVLSEMKREAEQLAREGDNFEMVRETRSIPDVMTLIERTYRESGEVLDVSEAMQLVEDELINESLKIARIKKVQGRLTPTQPAPQQQQPKQMKTLTDRDTSRIVLSAKARAMAAFYGNKK